MSTDQSVDKYTRPTKACTIEIEGYEMIKIVEYNIIVTTKIQIQIQIQQRDNCDHLKHRAYMFNKQ